MKLITYFLILNALLLNICMADIEYRSFQDKIDKIKDIISNTSSSIDYSFTMEKLEYIQYTFISEDSDSRDTEKLTRVLNDLYYNEITTLIQNGDIGEKESEELGNHVINVNSYLMNLTERIKKREESESHRQYQQSTFTNSNDRKEVVSNSSQCTEDEINLFIYNSCRTHLHNNDYIYDTGSESPSCSMTNKIIHSNNIKNFELTIIIGTENKEMRAGHCSDFVNFT